MEEFKSFVLSKIKSTGKFYLISAIVTPVISIAFWIWYFTAGTSITVPRIVAVVFVFGVFLSPVFLYLYFKNRTPEKSGVYKVLFGTLEGPKKYSVKKSYGSFVFSLFPQKGLTPKTLIIKSKNDAQQFLDYLKKYYPKAEHVK